MFKTPFGEFLCDGDTITCEVDGFRCEAWTEMDHDDYHTPPDERCEGFWPSLDPKDAGYIGPRSKRTLLRVRAQREAVMEAWRKDEWDYCGVLVRVFVEDIGLTGHYDHALWGIERNFPGKAGNEYLLHVANELLPEALQAAREKISKLMAKV
jgi:hypothetical protein